MKKNKGFSLMELMIVFIIFGLLGLLVVFKLFLKVSLFKVKIVIV